MALPSAQPRRSLTIGIDARAATEVRAGRGRVVRELLRALAASPDDHRYVCYARSRWDEQLDERFRWSLVRARDPWWHVRAGRLAGGECDVLLSTNSYLTVILTRAPSVAIIHDLMAFDRSTSPSRRSALIERLTLDGAVRRARGLVCVSQATADALRARFPAARSRITVAHLGVAPALGVAPPDGLEALPPPGFVLAVGTLEPRKNLPRLVSAYSSLPAELQAEHPLVIVGAAGWRTGPTFAALESLGARCTRLGHVSDAALAELYRRCDVFCYPSLGEGFGLPVLEAMAAGAAVVTSNVSSLPEVGGDAVLYADPRDAADIARALSRTLSDPGLRASLRTRGRERAGTFSWSAFAAEVLAAVVGAAG